MQDVTMPLSRRKALILGGSIAGGLVAASTPLAGIAAIPEASAHAGTARSAAKFSKGLIKHMENILQTDGTQSNGVLSFEFDRDDLKGYTVGGHSLPQVVPYSSAWENNGELYFQSLDGDNRAIFNGDMGGLLPQEIDPFVDQLLANDITFQAFHQHYTDIHPNQLYFIHMRAVGNPLDIARKVMAAIKVTGTPLPQSQSGTPTTPLPKDRLSQILAGPAQVGSEGVVMVNVPRRDTITLGGIPISPFLNIATQVSFLPLNKSGTSVAAAPDFGMVSSEIQHVVKTMRKQGWVLGCLYNQETAENPQLYFAHMLKVGHPVALAQEIRRGLDRMDSARP